MINPFKEVNWNPNQREKRQFARSLIIGFPLLGLGWMLIGRCASGYWHIQPVTILVAIGVILGVFLLVFSSAAKLFYVFWYAIACSIGLVVSNVLLITFYFTIFTIFGVVRRAFRRQALEKRFNKNASTYWRDAERISDPKRYYSQF